MKHIIPVLRSTDLSGFNFCFIDCLKSAGSKLFGKFLFFIFDFTYIASNAFQLFSLKVFSSFFLKSFYLHRQ